MSAPSTRLRPDPDLFLVELLRPVLTGVHVVNLLDTAALKRLPVVAARAVSPGTFAQTRNVRGRYPVGVDVQSWTEDRKAAADLDDAVLTAFVHAQETGRAAGGAHLALLEIDSPGSELRTSDQPGRLHRWAASYSFILRPA